MKRRAAILGLLVLPAVGRAQPAPIEHYILDVGGEQERSAVGVASYSLSGPNVVEVRLSPDGASFVFRGVRAGQTVLLLIMTDGSAIRLDFVVRAPT